MMKNLEESGIDASAHILGSTEVQKQMQKETVGGLIHDDEHEIKPAELAIAAIGNNDTQRFSGADLVDVVSTRCMNTVQVAIPPRRGRAKKRAATKSNISASPFAIELTPENVKCGICLEIFIEPVTYPCGHSACLECYTEHIAKAAMQCHLCRMRLSVWSRTVSKTHTFVNIPFWEKIKEVFGDHVSARQQGSDSKLSLSPIKSKVLDGHLARPGEILEDFERDRTKHALELQRERELVELASLEFIKTIVEEEGPLPEIQSASSLEEDMELARKLQEELEAEAKKTSPLVRKVKQKQETQPKNKKLPVVSQKQGKLNFAPVSPTPAAAVASLEELLRTEQEQILPEPSSSTFSIEDDYKFAKKLAAEERQAYRLEWLAENGRKTTRQMTKSSAQASASSKIEKKRQRGSSRGPNSQDAKRRRNADASNFLQGTLDSYVKTNTSPPSAAAGDIRQLNSSRSSTPDSINAEVNRHFQPIVRPPKTPPKRNPDGTLSLTPFVNLKGKVAQKDLTGVFNNINSASSSRM